MNTVSLCLVICRHYYGLYREIIWRVRSGLDYLVNYYPYDRLVTTKSIQIKNMYLKHLSL